MTKHHKSVKEKPNSCCRLQIKPEIISSLLNLSIASPNFKSNQIERRTFQYEEQTVLVYISGKNIYRLKDLNSRPEAFVNWSWLFQLRGSLSGIWSFGAGPIFKETPQYLLDRIGWIFIADKVFLSLTRIFLYACCGGGIPSTPFNKLLCILLHLTSSASRW